MIQTDERHTPEAINSTLREVLSHYVGQSVVLAIRDYGARKRSQVAGEIAEATAHGSLLVRAHGGREYISYMDIYAGHIEAQAPSTLAEDLGDALAHLGVHHRQHQQATDDGRFGARLQVAPNASGISRVKHLVG